MCMGTLPNSVHAYQKNVYVLRHPSIKQKVTLVRDEKTGMKEFAELFEEIAIMLTYEATFDLELESVRVKTPLVATTGEQIGGAKIPS